MQRLHIYVTEVVLRQGPIYNFHVKPESVCRVFTTKLLEFIDDVE